MLAGAGAGLDAAGAGGGVTRGGDSGDLTGAKEAIKEAQKTAKGGACNTTSPADGDGGPDDWSGGSKEKFAKCQSCKSFVLEVGGCKICESCTKRPWVMEQAWRKYQQEQKQQKAEAKKKEQMTELPEKNVTIHAGATAVATQFPVAA